MTHGKRALLNLYYYGTKPWRAWHNARRAAVGRAPIMVLFYHRVADDAANPWTVSNRTFAQQIRWLSRQFDVISLAEAQRRLRTGYVDRPAVSITFDDGYFDNCDQALPLLIERNIPCTYFVSTEHVFQGIPFAHDVALGKPLAPNTLEQIRELAEAGIEIGAHTRTHADLGSIGSMSRLFDEMVVSRDELESLVGRYVRYFAFPFGQPVNLSDTSFELARSAGYAGICSAYGGFNFPGGDAFHLERIAVDDDLIRLKNWTTVDPRKLRITPRYVPSASHDDVEAIPAQHSFRLATSPATESHALAAFGIHDA